MGRDKRARSHHVFSSRLAGRRLACPTLQPHPTAFTSFARLARLSSAILLLASRPPPMKITLLNEQELRKLHEASLRILETIGVHVPHPEMLKLFADAGAVVDSAMQRVRIPETLVTRCLETAGKSFTIYGRDRGKKAEFGLGKRNYNSSAGQALWVNDDLTRRYTTLEDVATASRLADGLPAINIVGSMSDPHELPVEWRCVAVAAEQIKNTTKPITFWFHDRASARFLMELFTVVAGSEEEAARYPLGLSLPGTDQPAAVSPTGRGPVVRDLPFEPAGADRADGAGGRVGGRHPGRHDGPAKRGNPGRAVHRAIDPSGHVRLLRRHSPRLRHANDPGNLRRPGAGPDGGRSDGAGQVVRSAGLHQRGAHRQQTARRPGRASRRASRWPAARWPGPTSLDTSASAGRTRARRSPAGPPTRNHRLRGTTAPRR